jgi:plastocyanin
MKATRNLFVAALLPLAACGGSTGPSPLPTEPPQVTANVYILPGAVNLGRTAFGDEPVVIHKGERMRWRNADGIEHDVVADAAVFPEFAKTSLLAPGGEQSFVMNTTGSTTIHCSIHPRMTGTLTVQ